MRFTSSHLLLCCCLLLGLIPAMPAHADVHLKASAISMKGVKLQAVTLDISDQAAGGIQLKMQAGQVAVASLGWRRVGLNLDGTVQRDPELRWIFDGTLRVTGAPGGALNKSHVRFEVSHEANTLLLDLQQSKAEAHIAMPLDQTSHAQVTLQKFPLAWLQGLLSNVWSGRLSAGRVDAELAVDVRDDGLQSSGQFTLGGASFDTPAGTLAGQALSGSGRFSVDTTDGPARIDLDSNLRGGELLLGSIYAKLPKHSVRLSLHASVQRGAVELSRLRINDPDALQVNGTLAFDAKGNLKKLKLDHFNANFPAAYQRYGQAWLSTLGLPKLSIDGQLSGSVDLQGGEPRSFAFTTSGLDFSNADGRLAASGLRGGLDWSAQGDRPATTLSWQSLQFYRVANGAAQSRWQSSGGMLSLLQPINIPVLKGQWHIAKFDWRPAAQKGQRLATSMAISHIDMAALSHAMGWPAFPGTLGGAIPSLRWVDNRFELQGGLTANVFGGFLDITQLSLEQPFGPAPALTADIHLNQLNLGAITSVFDFGSISGRLDGSIDNLRLVNWSPVAFKASLLANSGGRISQRAVNNLTAVGGGGIAAGLQGVVLKLFKTFSYSRIGLSCTLKGSVCQMGGLDSGNGGYTIVEGNGLPRLQVIGHQTQVDWPTLVRRLEATVHGTAPQVR